MAKILLLMMGILYNFLFKFNEKKINYNYRSLLY